MYYLHGFMVINSLVDNTLNQVSVLGELSAKARSFSREVGIYTDEADNDVRLMTFYSYEDTTKVPLSQELASHVLTIGQWLAKQSLSGSINDNRTVFSQRLSAEFVEQIKLEQVGKMVTNGSQWLPEYITFSLLTDKRKNRYKIWFSDNAFVKQYDKYELEVIPPIETIDDFFKGSTQVKYLIDNNSVVTLHQRVNKKADKHPYTYIISNTYSYIDPNDKTNRIPSIWTIILYGEAGRNEDILREALAKYILDNSDHTREEWEKILPDIFIPTEFYLCPIWNRYATENLQLRGGIYSPTVPTRDIVPWGRRTMYGYDDVHLVNYSVVFDSIFKSIAIVACGHPKNRLAPKEFELAWPEYANIYTSSRDFNRLSPETQEFILMMNKMLVEAETMTPDSDVPESMTRVQRGNMFYITCLFNNVSYVMPLRYNFLNEIAVAGKSAVPNSTVNNTGNTDEGKDRVKDVINMTADINLNTATGKVRGRTVYDTNNGTANGGITTTKQDKDGLENTPKSDTASTPAASEANYL